MRQPPASPVPTSRLSLLFTLVRFSAVLGFCAIVLHPNFTLVASAATVDEVHFTWTSPTSLTFTSQFGLVRLADLPLAGAGGAGTPPPPPSPPPPAPAASGAGTR